MHQSCDCSGKYRRLPLSDNFAPTANGCCQPYFVSDGVDSHKRYSDLGFPILVIRSSLACYIFRRQLGQWKRTEVRIQTFPIPSDDDLIRSQIIAMSELQPQPYSLWKYFPQRAFNAQVQVSLVPQVINVTVCSTFVTNRDAVCTLPRLLLRRCINQNRTSRWFDRNRGLRLIRAPTDAHQCKNEQREIGSHVWFSQSSGSAIILISAAAISTALDASRPGLFLLLRVGGTS